MVFPKTGEIGLRLKCFSDADMADDVDEEHLRRARLPLFVSDRLVAEAEGASTIDMRVRVHRDSHGDVLGLVATPVAGRAHRGRSSPADSDGGQSAHHRPCQESSPPRPEQTHRHQVSISFRIASMEDKSS